MKIGVTCTGGGLKGLSLHCGFFSALSSMGIEWTALSGTSAGGLAAGFMASGMLTEDFEDMLLNLKLKDYWSVDIWGQIVAALKKWRGWTGLVSGDPMRVTLKKHLPVSTFEECKCPVYVVVFNISKKSKEVLYKGDLVSALRATSAIPWIWEAEKIGGDYYWDGGGVSNAPAYELASRQPKLDLIIVSAVMDLGSEEQRSDSSWLTRDFTPIEASERYVHAISDELLRSNIDLADNDVPIFVVRHRGFHMGLTDVSGIAAAIEIGRSETLKQIQGYVSAPPAYKAPRGTNGLGERIHNLLKEIVRIGHV